MKMFDVVNDKWQVMFIVGNAIGHRDLKWYERFDPRFILRRLRRILVINPALQKKERI